MRVPRLMRGCKASANMGGAKPQLMRGCPAPGPPARLPAVATQSPSEISPSAQRTAGSGDSEVISKIEMTEMNLLNAGHRIR